MTVSPYKQLKITITIMKHHKNAFPCLSGTKHINSLYMDTNNINNMCQSIYKQEAPMSL